MNHLLRLHLIACKDHGIPFTTPNLTSITRLFYLLLTRAQHPRLAFFFSECLHVIDYLTTCLKQGKQPGTLSSMDLMSYNTIRPDLTCIGHTHTNSFANTLSTGSNHGHSPTITAMTSSSRGGGGSNSNSSGGGNQSNNHNNTDNNDNNTHNNPSSS